MSDDISFATMSPLESACLELGDHLDTMRKKTHILPIQTDNFINIIY